MKKVFLCLVFLTCVVRAMYAQVPYFSGTPGDGKLYGYTSLKFRPGINNQETYSCFQYGIGNHFAAGTDIYTGSGSAYWGFLVRGGYVVNKWFGIGAQLTPSFDLNDSFKFSYLTAALYMNGNITNDGKLFWCSNTWYGVNRGSANTITNWEYLGYSFDLPKGQAITPMVGMIHSWKFDQDPDLSVGLYYSVGKFNIYVWGNDFFQKNPRVVVGVDFKIPTKN